MEIQQLQISYLRQAAARISITIGLTVQQL